MKLRIATYNIHKGISSIARRPRVHALKTGLASLAADVVFLQEVQGRHDLLAMRHAKSWPDQGQHEFLANENQHSAYGMNAVYDHGHHGNALLSNFPIATANNHDVSDHAYESRGILHCVLQIQDVPVHCYVIHLGLFAGSRQRQTDALIEAVTATAPPGAPLIIAGDFNDWTNSLSATLRECLGVMEVFDQQPPSRSLSAYLRKLAGKKPRMNPARTFPAAMPVLQLDRIYVRGFKVDSAQVLYGPAWALLSDHAPLVANLSLTQLAQSVTLQCGAPDMDATYASGKL